MIFKPAARYPADPRVVIILALSILSGVATVAMQAAPASLAAVLPEWAVMAWGALLWIGSAITLAGISRNTLNGVIMEQIGSIMVAATTIFVSVVALKVNGPSSLSVTGIVLAWGIACIFRWTQLQALINSAYKDQVRKQVREAILSEIEKP